ncbi:3-coathanger stack domain-containing protein [Jiulongibacter sediminis]|uniref:Ig-like domain-containing protein n=1 Tax=Jiulongibacter sediminis TaxID=1605367 RepID=A0A0P7C6A2_9BACT|nr:3-coathanger stack domain-containing protein [Jiulongibacter sediminis]KPM47800.1 hypothetical protein AFM12_11100 [Jiulongibacter sediminis]TBX23984.1 hypothetical protein TK44_11105 [Jiulongibacter sediminis]
MKKGLVLLVLWMVFAQSAKGQITAGEYFWDTDPGVGQGTALSGSDLLTGQADESYDIEVDVPLSPGLHRVYVRFMESDSSWSPVESHEILIGPENHLATSGSGIDSAQVRQLVYYWDTLRTSLFTIDINSPSASFESQMALSLGPQSGGLHTLNLAVKDKYGLYSSFEQFLIFVSPENHLAGVSSQKDSMEVRQLQYFWNQDSLNVQTVALPSSDSGFRFTYQLALNLAAEGYNQWHYRVSDKRGMYSSWSSQSILVIGAVPQIDSVKYALKPTQYGYVTPENLLSVDFTTNSPIEFELITDSTHIQAENEIGTDSLSHGFNVFTLQVNTKQPVVSSISDSRNSAYYQAIIKVDSTIKLETGEPRNIAGDLSNIFCPGELIKIPVDTTGNWPDSSEYGIATHFLVKLKDASGSGFTEILSQMNNTGDTLIVTIPGGTSTGTGYQVIVESTFPLLRDTVTSTFQVGAILVLSDQQAPSGSSVDLTASAVTVGSSLPSGTTFSYFSDSSATIPVSNPTSILESGTYYIKATSSAGCEVIESVKVIICGGVFDPITAPINSGIVSNGSDQKITATNIISGSGTKVTYNSGLSVQLNPGFKADSGTVFQAEIGGCN